MILNDKVYNILKWVVIIALPAVNALVASLGLVLGFDSSVACGVLSAVTVFLGALIGVSNRNYYYDGGGRITFRNVEDSTNEAAE